MANININNNYGNVTVADTISIQRQRDAEMEAWIEEFYPNLMHSAATDVRRWKQDAPERNTFELEAKIEKLAEQVSMLVNLLATKEVIQ